MLVSIIIPTFTRVALVKESLLSCAKLGEIAELVVVDDCSTDGTGVVLSELAVTLNEAGTKMRVFYPAQNQGAPACRNTGLTSAQGKYVVFVDSDDVVVPGGVSELVECLQKDSALDYAYGKVIRTDEQLEPLRGNSMVGAPFSELPVEVAGYHWHTMGAIYRRSYLEKVGPWNEALTGSQDWEYQARVKLAGGRGEFVDTVVGYWRQHESARVGTRTFRYDYTHSVIKACESIAQHARQAGRYDRALANRLGGKMFLHGLEFSVHGFADEARRTFSQVKLLPEISPGIKALMSVFAFSPRLVNICAFRTIRAAKR